MENESNDPIKGVQNSIESIIGAPTFLKKRRLTQKDLDKDLFINIISILEVVQSRTVIMGIELGLDFKTYDQPFYHAIDSLIEFSFGKELSEIIFFYLYDRINPDGSINELSDDEGNTVKLENSADLWEIIQKLKIKTKKSKL